MCRFRRREAQSKTKQQRGRALPPPLPHARCLSNSHAQTLYSTLCGAIRVEASMTCIRRFTVPPESLVIARIKRRFPAAVW